MFRNIVYHWTAGNYKPSATDIVHYHFVIDGDGKVHTGKHKPEDNINCNDGKYAQHTGGGNTGKIGISICCRKDANTPPTKKQVESMCFKGAECCVKYGIQPNQCITHAEFGQTHPKTTSYGKIDITSIPYENLTGIKACADYLRNKTQVYYDRLKRE